MEEALEELAAAGTGFELVAAGATDAVGSTERGVSGAIEGAEGGKLGATAPAEPAAGVDGRARSSAVRPAATTTHASNARSPRLFVRWGTTGVSATVSARVAGSVVMLRATSGSCTMARAGAGACTAW